MDWKIKSRWRLIALGVAVLGGLGLLRNVWPDPRMSAAKRDISKIEAFRNAHGQLPNSLSDVGVTEDESGPVYYKKQDDQSYILWYGLSLGESETYDSRTHRWSDH